MREYGKLSVNFWTSGRGRLLRGDADALALAPYLFACPHGNMLGLFYLPVAYISNDLGMTPQGASKALRRVSEAGLIAFEEASEGVFVAGAGKWNVGGALKPKDNRAKNIRDLLSTLGKHPFYRDFLEMYAEPWGMEDLLLEAPSKPLGDPLRSQEQEQEQEQENKYTSSSSPSPAASAVREVFEHWAAVHEKKEPKLTADRKAKTKARLREGFTVEQLKRAVDGCRLSKFHMGENDSSKLYNDLKTILRDGSTTEGHIERANGLAAPVLSHASGGGNGDEGAW